jgi:hypothetical protein
MQGGQESYFLEVVRDQRLRRLALGVNRNVWTYDSFGMVQFDTACEAALRKQSQL